jgi:hypothetical protein
MEEIWATVAHAERGERSGKILVTLNGQLGSAGSGAHHRRAGVEARLERFTPGRRRLVQVPH